MCHSEWTEGARSPCLQCLRCVKRERERLHEVSSCQQSVQLLKPEREQLSQLHWALSLVPCWGRVALPALLHRKFSRRFLSIICSIILLVAAGRPSMGWYLLWVCEWVWQDGLGSRKGLRNLAEVWMLLLTGSAEQQHSCPVLLSASLKEQLLAEFSSLGFPCQQILIIIAFSRVSWALGKPFPYLKASEEGKRNLSQTNFQPQTVSGDQQTKFKALGRWREPASLKDTSLTYHQKQLWPCWAESAAPVEMESFCSSFCASNYLLGLVCVSIYCNSAHCSCSEFFWAGSQHDLGQNSRGGGVGKAGPGCLCLKCALGNSERWKTPGCASSQTTSAEWSQTHP